MRPEQSGNNLPLAAVMQVELVLALLVLQDFRRKQATAVAVVLMQAVAEVVVSFEAVDLQLLEPRRVLVEEKFPALHRLLPL